MEDLEFDLVTNTDLEELFGRRTQRTFALDTKFKMNHLSNISQLIFIMRIFT